MVTKVDYANKTPTTRILARKMVPTGRLLLDFSDMLTVVHIDAQSLLSHKLEIELMLNEQNIDILCVSETWLYTNISDAFINIPLYDVYRQDQGRGGGPNRPAHHPNPGCANQLAHRPTLSVLTGLPTIPLTAAPTNRTPTIPLPANQTSLHTVPPLALPTGLSTILPLAVLTDLPTILPLAAPTGLPIVHPRCPNRPAHRPTLAVPTDLPTILPLAVLTDLPTVPPPTAPTKLATVPPPATPTHPTYRPPPLAAPTGLPTMPPLAAHLANDVPPPAFPTSLPTVPPQLPHPASPPSYSQLPCSASPQSEPHGAIKNYAHTKHQEAVSRDVHPEHEDHQLHLLEALLNQQIKPALNTTQEEFLLPMSMRRPVTNYDTTDHELD
ncbi:uncharacterized protein LOC135224031 [Macrobrachium nipponense]|uniref:uncharacterized protein LOC135224031 n=1 Tax=Macrobrachium nipponense TaxID=159736 RepID=UPI0030C8C562